MKALVLLLLLALPLPAAAGMYWIGPWLYEDGVAFFQLAPNGVLLFNNQPIATIRHGRVFSLEGRFLGVVPVEPPEAVFSPAPSPAFEAPPAAILPAGRCFQSEDDFGTYTRCAP